VTKKVGAVGYGESRNAAGHSVFGHDAGTHDHKTPVGVRRQTNGNLKPMRWVSMHHHTTLSYGDGYGLPEAHARRAEELLLSGIVFTEHGNISSHVKAEAACEKHGIKPMFGCEMYMTNWLRKEEHTEEVPPDGHCQGPGGVQEPDAVGQSASSRRASTMSRPLTTDFSRGTGRDWSFSVGARVRSCSAALLAGSSSQRMKLDTRVLARLRAGSRSFGDDYFIEVQAFPELDKTRSLCSYC
jgi:DNA polymerase-3 subunit alpha